MKMMMMMMMMMMMVAHREEEARKAAEEAARLRAERDAAVDHSKWVMIMRQIVE